MKNYIVGGLVVLGAAIYGASTSVERDESGAIIGSGNVGAFSIRQGDCFNDAESLGGDDSEVSSVAGVPCSEPHDNEVYAVFDVSIAEYPGIESMNEIAFDQCLVKFEGFVGRDYESSSLDIGTLYPTASSWSVDGDREVICTVFDVEYQRLSGTARDSGL